MKNKSSNKIWWTLDDETSNMWRNFFRNLMNPSPELNLSSEMMNLLLKERVLPYFYFKLSEKIDDESIKEILKKHYLIFFCQNKAYRIKAEKIIKRMNDIGIVPIILKGIDLQDNFYPKIELRPTSDLDILIINGEQFHQANDEIKRMNYNLYQYRSKKYANYFSKDFAYLCADRNDVMVEIHNGLRFGKNDKRCHHDEIFYKEENLILHERGKIQYLGFSAEANYLYLIYHAFQSHFNLKRALWLLDLFVIKDKMDKDKMRALAKKVDLEYLVEWTEDLLNWLSGKEEKKPNFERERSPRFYSIEKIKREFFNIEGLNKKMVWILIWLFPEKDFLKKRYGDNISAVSLYFIYYFRMCKSLFKTLKGA